MRETVDIVFGQLQEYNRHRIRDKLDQYLKPLVVYKTGMARFANWVSNVSRPIIGDRILIVVFERDKLRQRDFMYNYQSLTPFLDHPYIDVMWVIEEYYGDIRDILVEATVTSLRKTHREDMCRYASEYIHNQDVCSVFLETTNYSWRLYNYHIHKLLAIQAVRPLMISDVTNNVTVEKSIRPSDILYKLLARSGHLAVNRKAVHGYYQLCRKYSEQWANQYMEKMLEDVIKLKIRHYIKRNIKISDMMNDDNQRQLVPIVTGVPAYRVYNLLTMFRESDNPIELFILHRDRYIAETAIMLPEEVM